MTSTSEIGYKNISVADNLVTFFTNAGITEEDIKNISLSQQRCQTLIHQLEHLQTLKSEGLDTFISKLKTADTAVINAVRALCQACLERDKIMSSYEAPGEGELFELSKVPQHNHKGEERETSSELKISLTEQEKKVVHLLKIGKTSKEIAVQLQLTVKTVRTYRERVLRKTKTRNVAELLNVCFHF